MTGGVGSPPKPRKKPEEQPRYAKHAPAPLPPGVSVGPDGKWSYSPGEAAETQANAQVTKPFPAPLTVEELLARGLLWIWW